MHAACLSQVKAKIPNPKDLEGKLAQGGAHSQVRCKDKCKNKDNAQPGTTHHKNV